MAVRWLAQRGLRGSNDNEWQGFYGEERAKVTLGSAFTPKETLPRIRYGNTTFDYALNWVWDIKVHTEMQVLDNRAMAAKNETLLNDEQAIRECIDEQGLGFLIIGGAARMDESGEFLAWHRAHKSVARGRACALELGEEPPQEGGLRSTPCRGFLAAERGCAPRGHHRRAVAAQDTGPTGAKERW